MYSYIKTLQEISHQLVPVLVTLYGKDRQLLHRLVFGGGFFTLAFSSLKQIVMPNRDIREDF